MKLSSNTVEILKNFALINPSMLFRQGEVQRAVSSEKTVLAKATIAESFTKEFAIYDLTQFINTLSLFEDAELDHSANDKYVVIKNNSAKTKFFYANKELILKPPEKDYVIPDSVQTVAFDLSAAALAATIKAANILQLPEIALICENGQVSFCSVDSQNVNSNTFEYPVGCAEGNHKMMFKVDNLKILSRDYSVVVTTKGIAHFKAKSGDVEYWIATEAPKKKSQ